MDVEQAVGLSIGRSVGRRSVRLVVGVWSRRSSVSETESVGIHINLISFSRWVLLLCTNIAIMDTGKMEKIYTPQGDGPLINTNRCFIRPEEQ